MRASLGIPTRRDAVPALGRPGRLDPADPLPQAWCSTSRIPIPEPPLASGRSVPLSRFADFLEPLTHPLELLVHSVRTAGPPVFEPLVHPPRTVWSIRSKHVGVPPARTAGPSVRSVVWSAAPACQKRSPFARVGSIRALLPSCTRFAVDAQTARPLISADVVRHGEAERDEIWLDEEGNAVLAVTHLSVWLPASPWPHAPTIFFLPSVD